MTTESKRDLNADLSICEAAESGPWEAVGIGCWTMGTFISGVTGEVYEDADAIFIAEAREGWPHAIRRAIVAEARVAELCYSNAYYIKAAERAEQDLYEAEMELDAEEQRRRMFETRADEWAYDNERLRKVIIDILAAIDRGDLIHAKMSSGVDYVIRCAREAISDE